MLIHKHEKSAVAWFFALAGIFPIAAMVWFSLIGNADILASKYIPSPRDNTVTFSESIEYGDRQYNVTATKLGQIFVNGKEIKNINSLSTKYVRIGRSLWAVSANKGLMEISLSNTAGGAGGSGSVSIGDVKKHYNWNFFEESYNNFDPTRFYFSDDILPEHFSWLAGRLNSSPAIPDISQEDSIHNKLTIADIAGIKFYPSQEIINQLNWILANEKAMERLFENWKHWSGWINPEIHDLFSKKTRTERENRFLFRWCISELFPNKISRFRHFPWQNIWISQVVSLDYSVMPAGNKIIIGMRGEIFPGLAIFNTETREINWVTEATGLPNSSIHNISRISDDDILVTHDLGTSIIQQESGKIISNSIDIFNAVSANAPSPIIAASETAEQSAERFTPPAGSRALQWSNYQDITRMIPLGTFIQNSMIICFGVAFLSVLFALFPSYAIARLKFKGHGIFTKAVLSTQVLSGLPFLIPVFVIFTLLQINGTRLFNSYFTIIFVNLIFFLPMAIQFFFSIFANLPENLEESAILDGCTPWQAFRRVILPSSTPGIVACFVYIFLFAWDEILFIWILSTDLTTATLPVGIRMAVGQFANHPELLMAFCVAASAPVIILFLLAQPFLAKYLVRRGR